MMNEHKHAIPVVRCVDIVAPKPSLHDNTADLDRLKKVLNQAVPNEFGSRSLKIPFQHMGSVAASFREAGFRGCAVLNILQGQIDIVDFLPAMPKTIPAMALDLGTTHLEATLVDLLTGKKLAHAHAVNRQIEYGTDILSRIHFATRMQEDESGLAVLQQAVVAGIDALAAELARSAGVEVDNIRALSVSGNTTMVHLLLGLSPGHICREPYIPLVNAPDPFTAGEIGLRINAAAPVWVLPSIGSYFGGDLISGILAGGLDTKKTTCMLIDVGTNAEVVLGNSDWLIACAGAAGPALEGGVAKMGMRAGPGAIDHVRLDTKQWQLDYQTIDGAPAAGICGSGLIDLVAELYLARIVDLRGKFRFNHSSGSRARKDFVRQRLVTEDGEARFIVAPAEESVNGQPVILGQIDLDAMMRSKAAMYAILTTLTAQVGVEFTDLGKIYVAGAFGKHIDPRRAIILGMLPDLPFSTYEPVGNSSLKGAELVLLDEEVRKRSLEIGRKITYIELNVNQEFMIRFSGSRFIPHTDPHLFPSVPVFSDCDQQEKA